MESKYKQDDLREECVSSFPLGNGNDFWSCTPSRISFHQLGGLKKGAVLRLIRGADQGVLQRVAAF